jgi:hypothetical protein
VQLRRLQAALWVPGRGATYRCRIRKRATRLMEEDALEIGPGGIVQPRRDPFGFYIIYGARRITFWNLFGYWHMPGTRDSESGYFAWRKRATSARAIRQRLADGHHRWVHLATAGTQELGGEAMLESAELSIIAVAPTMNTRG